MMALQQAMQQQFNIPVGDNRSGTKFPFTGTININGKVRQFKTLEEYEAARREAFGPAAGFGDGWIP